MRTSMTWGVLLALGVACNSESPLDDGIDTGGGSGVGGTSGTRSGSAGDTSDEGGNGATFAGASSTGGGMTEAPGEGNAGDGSGGGSSGAPADGNAGDGSGGGSSGAPGEGNAGDGSDSGGSSGAPAEGCGFEISDGSDLGEESWPPEEQCEPRERAPSPNAVSVAPLAGTWLDESGDPSVELVLDAAGQGTLLYGAPAELPPITDADEPYLIDVGSNDMPAFDRENMSLGYRLPRNGFRYTVIPQFGASSELTFVINTSEPWTDWCARQQPVRGANCYECDFIGGQGMLFLRGECSLPPGCYADIDGDALLPVHCGRALLCTSQSICSCDADECFAYSVWSRRSATVTLDAVDPSVMRFAYQSGEPRYLRRAP